MGPEKNVICTHHLFAGAMRYARLRRAFIMRIAPTEIAFDVDGVFADTFHLFVAKAHSDYGYQFEYEDITEYDFMKVLDMDAEASDAIIQTLLDHPLESGVEPITGAVEVLTRLSRLAPLHFVTARPQKKPILDWVEYQLPEVDRTLIRLEVTGAHTEKIPVLLEKGFKYFVDDRLDTCPLLEQNGITPILFEQPWNRKLHPYHVVRDWEDISMLIEWP
jgi:uncharacterized HAD superfamily protein